METRDVGAYRMVRFRAGPVDPVSTDVDLLIVGMPQISSVTQAGSGASSGASSGGGAGACALDAALAGTLSQLRAGGLFEGRIGEIMVLSSPPPPVRCRSLLIVGMGDIDLVDPDRLGMLTMVAMRAALQLDSCSIACLLNPLAPAAEAARAMMTGALTAVDAHANGDRFAGMNWTFDLRADHPDRMAEHLKGVIDQWPVAPR